MGKKGGGRVRVKQVGPKGPKAMVNPMADLMTPPEDMINLPPPPDRSFQLFWPISKSNPYLLCGCMMVPYVVKSVVLIHSCVMVNE